MKQLFFIACLFVGGCSSGHITVKTPNSFILTDVNIIDVEAECVLKDRSIVVIDGKINAIVAQSEAKELNHYPINLTQVSGHGGFVTPGLIDMHVHPYEPQALAIMLSHGVTHARIMNGIPAHLKWRDAVNQGELVGSTVTVSSPILSGYNSLLHRTITSSEQARETVKNYHDDGYDLIKAYNGLSADALEAIISEARKHQMPVAKHGPHAVDGMSTQLLSGMQSMEHVEDIFQGHLHHEFDREALPSIMNELSMINVPITPTLNIFEQLVRLSQEKERFINTIPTDYLSTLVVQEDMNNQVKRWLSANQAAIKHNENTFSFLLDITQQLHENEIPLLVGSDSGVLLSPHGLATHNEMRLMQKAGMTPMEVLRSATMIAANALQKENQLGQIKPGFNADFILTLSNPLDRLAALENPQGVSKSGIWYDERRLLYLRAQAIQSRSLWQEIWDLVEAVWFVRQ